MSTTDARARIRAYLDAVDRVNAKSSIKYHDTVHGLNDIELRASDLRTLLGEKEQEAPTDDEAEALTRRFADAIYHAGLRAPDSTLAVIAFKEVVAGWRRQKAPADDEREALANVSAVEHGGVGRPDRTVRVGYPLADAIHAAGWRRQEPDTTEPTAEQIEAAKWAIARSRFVNRGIEPNKVEQIDADNCAFMARAALEAALPVPQPTKGETRG